MYPAIGRRLLLSALLLTLSSPVAAQVRIARVYTYSLPDLKLLPNPVDLGGRPDWVTFTPDSKLIYITTENTDLVHAIDVASRKEVAQIKVGKSPKRNNTAVIR